jgi:hypothetical protein
MPICAKCDRAFPDGHYHCCSVSESFYGVDLFLGYCLHCGNKPCKCADTILKRRNRKVGYIRIHLKPKRCEHGRIEDRCRICLGIKRRV